MLEYSIDQARQLIITRVGGTDNTCEQFQRLWGQMYRDPGYEAAFDHLVLIDPDAGGPIQENIPQICSMLEVVARADEVRKKWAVVVSSLGKRLLLEFLFAAVDFGRVRLRVFATEADATAWLQGRDEPRHARCG